MKKEFSDINPILEINHGCIVAKTGDYTLAFEITKPEIFSLGSDELEAWHQGWLRAIRLLPAGTVLHFQDWYTRTHYCAAPQEAGDSFLRQSSEAFFHGRPSLQHRSYLFITKKANGRKSNGPGLSSLLQTSLFPAGTLDERAVREFLNQVGQFLTVLSDGGVITISQMDMDDLAGNTRNIGIIEQYCQLSTEGGQKPIIRDISFDRGLRIGDLDCCIYSLGDVEGLPAHCSPSRAYAPYSSENLPYPIGWATPLGPLLDCEHICNLYIFLEPPQPTLQKLELKRRRMQSLSSHSRENAMNRAAVDEFLNEATREQQVLVKMHCNIMGWAKHLLELEESMKKIAAAIAQIGAVPKLETISAPQVWWAGIPGNAADLAMSELFDTFAEQAVCFLAPETNYRSSASPDSIRLGDRITGTPVSIDIGPESLQKGLIGNFNKFVLGGSGSGKSFIINHLMRHYYEMGHHIVIVDMGNSYQGLCQLKGGYYFRYTEKTPIRFNPFYLAAGESLDTEKKESIKTLLVALWKREDETFLRSEYVALSNALQGYYEWLAKNPIFPCFDSFYEFLQDEFVRVLAGEHVEKENFDINNFLYVLRPFYEGGEYHFLLNAREQLDLLDQRMVVFEIDELKNNPILFPVVTIVIAEIFIRKMRKLPGLYKTILIEEAWKAIAHSGMSEYIKYLFKTVRKFNGQVLVVTQEIEDIISSPVVKQAIINNADCKILLDQSKFRNKFDQIQALLGLTEKEKTQVLSLNKANEAGRKYKEVFISLGSNYSQVFRTEVSPAEYYCYTTNESEKVRVQAYAEKYGGYEAGIRALVDEIKSTHQ